MSRKIYKQAAIEFGEEFAKELFNDFQDPERHGPNFSLEKFPDMVKRMAYVSCGLNLFWEEKTKQAEKLKLICAEAAYEKSKDLLKLITPINYESKRL